MLKRLGTGLAYATVLAFLAMGFALAGDDQVMVTRPGVVFHLAGAHDFHGHAVGKSRDAALAAGYMPCPVCFGKTAAANTAARPGAGSATAAGQGPALAPFFGPRLPQVESSASRGASRVMATGCTSHDAVCPYGLPFRTTPGL